MWEPLQPYQGQLFLLVNMSSQCQKRLSSLAAYVLIDCFLLCIAFKNCIKTNSQ